MSKCSECSKLQLTCCELEVTEVAITNGDIRRISDYTGRNDFYHLKQVSEEMKYVYENPANVPKGLEQYVEYLFDEEGRRNILKKNERNGCCFLTPNGCALPSNIKPIICRLFPYDWNDNRDVWMDFTTCPKILFKDEQELKELVCLPEEEAKRLIDLLYYEIMNESECRPTKNCT